MGFINAPLLISLVGRATTNLGEGMPGHLDTGEHHKEAFHRAGSQVGEEAAWHSNDLCVWNASSSRNGVALPIKIK